MLSIIMALYLLQAPSSVTEIAREVYMTDGAVRQQLGRYLDRGGEYVQRTDDGYVLTKSGRAFSARVSMLANNTLQSEPSFSSLKHL